MSGKKRLLPFAKKRLIQLGLAVIVGVALTNSYPRQLVFGPKIKQLPLCVWQAEVRQKYGKKVPPGGLDKVWSWFRKGEGPLEWWGISPEEWQTLCLSLYEDEDPGVRQFAASNLVGGHDESTIDVLVRLFDDPDRRVRIAAAWNLSKFQDKSKVVAKLAPFLEHADAARRGLALSTLAGMPARPHDRVALLIRFLRDPDATIRANAASQLTSFANQKRIAKVAAPQLQANLSDPDPLCRLLAAQAHWSLMNQADVVLPVVRKELASSNREIRFRALGIVERMHGAGLAAWDDVVPCALTGDSPAFSCLVHGGGKAVPVLLVCCGQTDGAMDVNIMWCLQQIGPPAKELARLVMPNPKRATSDVLNTIGHLRAEEFLPDVLAYLDADDVDLRAAAAEALGRFGPAARTCIPKLLALLGLDEKSASAAAHALGRIGEPECVVPALVALLKDVDKSDAIHAAACDGLAAFGPKAHAAVPALSELHPLLDEAVQALGAIGPAAWPATERLAQHLHGVHRCQRANLIDALGKIGHDPAVTVPRLAGQLREDRTTRLAAIAALSRFGPMARQAIPALAALVEDESNDDVSTAAADALAKIDPARFDARKVGP